MSKQLSGVHGTEFQDTEDNIEGFELNVLAAKKSV
jgi:hypothetical protein